MKLTNLDELTREKMLDEVDRAERAGQLHLSNRLTEEGRKRYPDLLRRAVRAGDAVSFAAALRSHLRTHYETQSGKRQKVPTNAAEILADGEFNHFYVRAMCTRAAEEGRSLEVYRAGTVEKPRPKSEALIGTHPEPDELLASLRAGLSFRSGMDVPGGPGSKISVRFTEDEHGV